MQREPRGAVERSGMRAPVTRGQHHNQSKASLSHSRSMAVHWHAAGALSQIDRMLHTQSSCSCITPAVPRKLPAMTRTLHPSLFGTTGMSVA